MAGGGTPHGHPKFPLREYRINMDNGLDAPFKIEGTGKNNRITKTAY